MLLPRLVSVSSGTLTIAWLRNYIAGKRVTSIAAIEAGFDCDMPPK
jgi:hypothetical protein